MTVVLGLDTNSHSTGFALFNNQKLKEYGIIAIPKKWSMPRRLLSFFHQLELLVDRVNPDHIVIEDLKYLRNKNSTNTLAAFLGVARMISYDRIGTDAILVGPTSVKMIATGSGRAEKIDVIKAANKQFKIKLSDTQDDIADAIFVGVCGLKELVDGH